MKVVVLLALVAGAPLYGCASDSGGAEPEADGGSTSTGGKATGGSGGVGGGATGGAMGSTGGMTGGTGGMMATGGTPGGVGAGGAWDWGSDPKPPQGQPNDFLTRSFKSDTAGLTLPYRLYVPPSYKPTRKYAIIVFFHGAGEKGSDNMAQLTYGAVELTGPDVQHQRPAFVLAPQCPEGPGQWVDWPWSNGSYQLDSIPISKAMTATLEALAALQKEYSIDPARILVTGLSMGGFGTWDAAMRNPNLFAAAMPICGGADPSKASLLKDMPIWTFHGSADDVVPVTSSRMMVDALRAAGGNIKYTEYPGGGHNVWGETYANPEVLRWLIDQHK
jgi:predicted peptidase